MAAMVGKESRRRFRRPKVSIVQIAGPANTKFTAPEERVRDERQVSRRNETRTEPERRDERCRRCETPLDEDVGTVVCDGIDTAELLPVKTRRC